MDKKCIQLGTMPKYDLMYLLGFLCILLRLNLDCILFSYKESGFNGNNSQLKQNVIPSSLRSEKFKVARDRYRLRNQRRVLDQRRSRHSVCD